MLTVLNSLWLHFSFIVEISPAGTLSVLDSFDYRTEKGYVLTVVAKGESSSKTSSTTVTLSITNDDGPPVFVKKSYEVVTQENVNVGTALLVAGDGFRFSTDGRPATDFVCSLDDITSREILDHFQVDRIGYECHVKVIKNFVQVSNREFTFQVRVTDINQRNLFDKAGVTVKVTDTNDYAPEFTQSSYWVSIASDTSLGTSLVQVTVFDRDTPGKTEFVLELLSEGADDRCVTVLT